MGVHDEELHAIDKEIHRLDDERDEVLKNAARMRVKAIAAGSDADLARLDRELDTRIRKIDAALARLRNYDYQLRRS